MHDLAMNEEQIIEGCKALKRDAQKALYEKYSRTMYGVCLRYSADEDAAKDLLQDGFIKVFSRIQSFENRGSFEGWLKRIFVNLALENLRKTKDTSFNSDNIETIADEIEDESIDDDSDSISADELLKMIKSLPEGYSAVFNLYAIENYSHKEISKMLNITESTSRSQYLRARNVLQGMVKELIKKKDGNY